MRKAFILSLLVLFSIGNSEASRHNTIQGIRASTYESHTRVVVDLKAPFEYTQDRISDPDRLFFDLKGCLLPKKVKRSISIKDGILNTVRVAQYNRDTVRIVLDIHKLGKYYSFMLDDPYRLVIDVYSSRDALVHKPEKNQKKKYDDFQKQFNAVKTVVIDPGHGGKDPGAVGPRGLQEKDITLQVGKKLGKILKKEHGMNVVYTRKKDVFVPLNSRTHIANSHKADLFISVHVNSSRKRNTRGIETYFLNWTNDREAMRVAARENKISVKKMKKIQNETQFILADLARKNKNEESMRLAHSVQNSMITTLNKQYGKIENLGVKYALFYVLVGAQMPSILVEVSFISNKVEEKRLSTEAYKNKIAEAIAGGINAYISQSTLIVRPDTEIVPGG